MIALLSNFNNDASQPLSQAAVVMRLDNLSAYEVETSWNQAYLTSTADGWRNLGIAQTCYYLDLLNNAISTFDPFVDFSQYTRILITFPPPAGGCGFAGQGTIGDWTINTADGNLPMSVSWIPATYVDMRVTSHEFGHNFGVWHANSLACGPARAYSSMVFDPATGLVVTYGGLQYGGRTGSSIGYRSVQTWEYDPGTDGWTNAFAPAVPGDRSTGSMAWAGPTLGPVFFGGYTSPGSYDNKLYAYNAATDTWSNTFAVSKPTPRGYAALANDTDGKLVLFGGNDGTVLGDTWEYDPATNNWTQQFPTTPPAARYLITNAMTAVGGGKFILFGGYSGASGFAQTWEYDISTHNWTLLAPGGSLPPATWAHSLTWDPDAKKVVMIYNTNTLVRLYDPSTNMWSSASPVPHPQAKNYHFATYDEVNRRVLVFGGTNLANNGEIWSYNVAGNAWTKMSSVFGMGTHGFDACYSAEYGHPWDSMGLSGPTHYDAEQKSIIGWLNESQSLTAVNGTFDIQPLEPVPSSEVQIKVPFGAGLHYTIDFRKAFGYDAGKTGNLYAGVVVGAGGIVKNGGDTHMVDMNLASGTFDDGALVAGSTYVDAVNGIEIETISVNSTVARVRIGGTPDSSPPSVTIISPGNGDTVFQGQGFIGTAADDVGIWWVDLQVNGGAWQRATGKTAWNLNLTYSAGSNTVCARAVDTGLNPSASECISVTWAGAPEISVTVTASLAVILTLLAAALVPPAAGRRRRSPDR